MDFQLYNNIFWILLMGGIVLGLIGVLGMISFDFDFFLWFVALAAIAVVISIIMIPFSVTSIIDESTRPSNRKTYEGKITKIAHVKDETHYVVDGITIEEVGYSVDDDLKIGDTVVYTKKGKDEIIGTVEE